MTSRVDWSEVLSKAEALAATGRDLRLLVIVTRAMANEGGIDPATGYTGYAGLARGLEMLTQNVTTFWDTLHPSLREGLAPSEAGLRRINALMQLENEDNGLLGDLEMNAVIVPQGLGAVSGHDLAMTAVGSDDVLQEYSRGLSAKEEARLTAEHEARVNRVRAVTRELAAEKSEIFDAISQGRAAARAALDALAKAVNDRLGIEPGKGVRFAQLAKFLDRVGTTLEDARAHVAGDAAGGGIAEEGEAPAGPVTATADTGEVRKPQRAGNGAVNSRQDVERALDAIVAFYERTEPASPIPHLARRMRRMVQMDFMQLIEELAPGGAKEFRSVAGIPDEKRK